MPRWLVAALVPGVIVIGLLVAWGADALAHRGEVGRNVTVAGDTVGGLGDEDLRVRVEAIAERFAQTPVLIDTPEDDVELDTGRLGVTVDVDATIANAKAASSMGNPISWLGSVFGTNGADVVLSWDADAARTGLDDLSTVRTEPTEGRLDGSSGELVFHPGNPGQRLDIDGIVEAIPAAIQQGGSPIVVEAQWTSVPPELGLAEFTPLIDDAALVIDSGAVLTVNDYEATLPPGLAATWFSSEFDDDGVPQLVIDREKVTADVEELMAPGGAGGTTEAIFTVEDGEVIVSAAEDARICCTDEAYDVLFEALADPNRDASAPIELPVRIATPEEVVAEAEQLGIVELVGEFTTPHNCCEGRVTNIQLFADLMTGVVIEPGETLSLNETVGQRTTEKGFVSAGAIQNGVLVSGVGGGVSQFATTIFNAAFFAGLEFPEYQAHTIYFSRYPYGREATINYPNVDLKIHNPTPYGILVWPSYTDTSITVQLYSTKFVEAEQTGQTTAWSGVCRIVRTERTRTYLTGEVVVDTVGAQYRPEGQLCDGSPSDPNATTTTEEETTTTSEGDGEGTTTTSEGGDTTTTTAADTTTTTAADTTPTTTATTTTTAATTTTTAATTTTTAATTTTTAAGG